MLPLTDLLTWEAIRDLTTGRAMRDGRDGIRWTGPETKWGVFRVNSVGHVRKEAHMRDAPAVGEIIGTRDAWWHPWRETLTAAPNPYVLVSNFHDAQVTDAAVETIMGPRSSVCAWFAVQVNTDSPRVMRMPIGTRAETVTALSKATRRPAEYRDIPLYVNFKRRNAERERLWDQFTWAQREPWAVDGTPRYADALGRAKFVLSPPGRGWDCYRTYEAIAMGAIPIVRRQAPISRIVDGLPVLVVDNWAEVTPERLESEWAVRQTAPDLTRITTAYWRERILSAARTLKEWHMARTSKARTEAYDNIAVGSANSARERTISGSLPPAQTTWGNAENIAVGVAYGADENLVVTATDLLAAERLTP
jgi:hypothetical protein